MHPTALLFAVHQVRVHITLSVVLFFGNFGGQNQQSLSVYLSLPPSLPFPL